MKKLLTIALVIIAIVILLGLLSGEEEEKEIPKPDITGVTGWVSHASNPIFKSDASLLDGFPNDPWVIKDGDTYVMY